MAMPDKEIRPSKIQESGDMPVLGRKRILNALGDPPDIRDRIYEPALVRLEPSLKCLEPDLVLDQGAEGACTGFGLAAVINLLKFKVGQQDFRASTRMLYEMANRSGCFFLRREERLAGSLSTFGSGFSVLITDGESLESISTSSGCSFGV